LDSRNVGERVLGKSGIALTEVGLGLWAAGGSEWGPIDDQKVLDTIDYALDAGINFYDTADVYGLGHSEKLLGRAMKGRRDEFIVATKIGWIGFDEGKQSTQYDSVAKLVAGVESNLQRLQTDHVDLLQSHINFQDQTTEIFIEGFEKLKRDGKVLSYGISTSDFELVKFWNRETDITSLQIDYSILNRTPEAEIFPYCQQNDIGIIVRGGLAMGILTGKFNAGSHFGPGDFRRSWHDDPEQKKIYLSDLDKVERLKPLADGRTLAQLALQFTLAHPAVTTVIPGAKYPAQFQESVGAALLPMLSADELAAVETVTPTGGGRKIWPA